MDSVWETASPPAAAVDADIRDGVGRLGRRALRKILEHGGETPMKSDGD